MRVDFGERAGPMFAAGTQNREWGAGGWSFGADAVRRCGGRQSATLDAGHNAKRGRRTGASVCSAQRRPAASVKRGGV